MIAGFCLGNFFRGIKARYARAKLPLGTNLPRSFRPSARYIGNAGQADVIRRASDTGGHLREKLDRLRRSNGPFETMNLIF
jgi:hypothetical protein